MKLYFECEKDHLALDASSPSVRASVARRECPVCPGESLEARTADASAAEWSWCGCCGSGWKLEGEGFACWPAHLVEEWE
jgi:hypothetical protein